MKNRFKKYYKRYKKEIIVGPILKLLEAIFDLLIPIIVANIIDKGIDNLDYNYVIENVKLLIILASVGVFIAIVAQYLAAKASVGISSRIRDDLFKNVQKISFKELDKIGEANIINTISNDTFQIQTGINLLLRLALRSPFIVFGSFIMAMLISYRVGIIFFIVIVLTMLSIYTFSYISSKQYENIQILKDSLLVKVRDNLIGSRVIRAFGIENDEINEFNEINDKYISSEKNAINLAFSMNSLNYVFINFGIVAIIAMSGVSVNFGSLTNGEAIALYNYMAQILVEIIKLTNLLILLPKTIASFKRVNNILKIENSLVDGKNDFNKIIKNEKLKLEFKHVNFKFNDGDSINILEDINFSISEGETMGIIGSTSAGKSSIINLIPRFYDVNKGDILINNINIKDFEITSLRNEIGIVMQDKKLFKNTILENINFGNRDVDQANIENAIRISQSEEIIENKIKGLSEEIEEAGSNLSGGQKQRICIARAIARNPRILLLDDCMSALDLLTESKIKNEIRKIKNTLTIIVSQRISSIKDLDKILVIDKGKVVGYGKHEELLNNCMVYQEIYNSQQKKEVI